MSDDTRLNGIQRVEGVANGTDILVSISSSNQLDAICSNLVDINNNTNAVETFIDGIETELISLGNTADVLYGEVVSQGNTLDAISTNVLDIELGLTTANGYLQAIGNNTDTLESKLPSTIGAHNSTDALCVVPATDAVFQIGAPENAFQLIRTWTGASADSEGPTDLSSWVTLTGANAAGYLVLHFIITAVGGTVSPTQVTFRAWGRVGGAGGTIMKVDEWVADASYLTLTNPTNPYWRRILPFNCDEVYVTATFPDGTSPTITGTCYARLVAHAGMQKRDFQYDPATGYIVMQPRGYEPQTDTIKNSPATFEADLALEEALVVDTTGLTAGTEYYYPSADGILMSGYDSVSWEYSCTAAGGGTIQVWWEATNGSNSWTQRNIVTLSGWEYTLGAQNSSTPITSAANGTDVGLCNFDNFNVTRMRMVVKPVTANSGAVKISLRRKVRGS